MTTNNDEINNKDDKDISQVQVLLLFFLMIILVGLLYIL